MFKARKVGCTWNDKHVSRGRTLEGAAKGIARKMGFYNRNFSIVGGENNIYSVYKSDRFGNHLIFSMFAIEAGK